ncbi:hypothetical protein [Hymenobacter defluvii]|uniref:Uncharacterized protein n=1 Tax=Hymenobacter defluvii TaxID=2054411 RepID=A0ABS3TLB5_9BACT|nr:hypothetical protein [Hymenobacter defluvii]MBO3273495.1 hypothetical protein [Hymenobacter defluvii]
MLQLEIIRSFLKDPKIQQKYGITATEVESLTMTSQHQSPFIDVVRRMVKEVEDESSVTVAAAQLNLLLEKKLK